MSGGKRNAAIRLLSNQLIDIGLPRPVDGTRPGGETRNQDSYRCDLHQHADAYNSILSAKTSACICARLN